MAATPPKREAPAIAAPAINADVHLDMFGMVTSARVPADEDAAGARLPVASFAMKRAVALRWADFAEIHQPALAAKVRAVCARKAVA